MLQNGRVVSPKGSNSVGETCLVEVEPDDLIYPLSERVCPVPLLDGAYSSTAGLCIYIGGFWIEKRQRHYNAKIGYVSGSEA